MHVWLLTNTPSPYQVELFLKVSEVHDVKIRVRYMCGGTRAGARPGLRGVRTRWLRDELRLSPSALWDCIFGRFDVYVLSGTWASVTFLLCALALKARAVPWTVWLERPRVQSAWEADRAMRMWGLLHCLGVGVRKWLLRSTSAVLCIGTAARDGYVDDGVPRENAFVLPYCCDTRRFDEEHAEDIVRVKDLYELKDMTTILFSGQMIERKGVDTLLEAFCRIAYKRSNVALLLLGDGVERRRYERSVPLQHRSRVHFVGNVCQRNLPAYYGAADIFVHPSRRDGWAVVINEACAAGLPVITTFQTGAAYDLVENGSSGFVIERDDVNGLVDRLARLIDDPELRRRFGQRSREMVEPYSAENGAVTMVEYLRKVLDRSKHSRPVFPVAGSSH